MMLKKVPRTQRPPNAYDRALRLVFRQTKSRTRLTSITKLRMKPPPPHALRLPDNVTGTSLELRDRKGNPLYRRAVANPFSNSVEVLAEGSTTGLVRANHERLEDTFFFIVPDLADAVEVVIETRGASTSARRVSRVQTRKFKLKKKRRKGG